MSNIVTIGTSAIREFNGFYSLNDLHKASGGEKKHQPNNFIRLEQTQSLIHELSSSHLRSIETVIGKGKEQGTYACRELVIAYAAWISAAFHLQVIRVFLDAHDRKRAQVTESALIDQIKQAVTEAIRPGARYHYPKRLLDQEYFSGPKSSVRVSGSQLSHPKFVSPLSDLLNRLEAEGHVVEACRKEYEGMKKALCSYHDFLQKMQLEALAVRMSVH